MTEPATSGRRFGPAAIAITAVVGLALGAGAGFGAAAVLGGETASERLESAVRGCTSEPGGAADVANFATVTDANHLEYVADGEIDSESAGNAHYANMSCLLSSVGVSVVEFPAIMQGPYDLSFDTDLATATVVGDDFNTATLTIELH